MIGWGFSTSSDVAGGLPAVRSPYVFYRLPHLVAAGSWHMATDRALLGWVSMGNARLVYRTYSWERPTLSLGRSEKYPEGWDEEGLSREGIEVVRRPTGGNAVLHAEEVTFALAASIPGPWGLTPRGFANAAAECLSRALLACGVKDTRVHADRRPSPGAVSSLCFARSAPGEVLAGGFKVAGIASRFGRTGAVCHASVPLTARSRSISRFRLSARGEAEALERNARSLGELLGAGAEGLQAAIAESLASEVASRFGARWTDAGFAAVGVTAEPALVHGVAAAG
jgi:lipoate-protein ligase A